jgi:NAD(P)-dependent dehydrogenase (short-subunit alcohol dehydrogenase family)
VILWDSARIAITEGEAMSVVVITGATRGIGRAAASEIAASGAQLALVGREPDRVAEVVGEAQAAGASSAEGYVADLTLMSAVRRLASEIAAKHEQVGVLANNAGAMFATRRVTSEGFEQTFALNHLAPFLLTSLLREQLRGGRVVTTASDAHKGGCLNLDDLQASSSFSAPRVYGTSKLCNILFTRELAKRAPELHANCFHPGVVRTGFGKNEGGIWKALVTLGGPFLRSPERGARSLTWLAISQEAAPLSGKYIFNERVHEPSAQAQDETLAEGLWEQSEALL